MSRQMLISVGILILIFASGVASGLFLGSGAPSASGNSEKAAGTASSGISPTAEGQERIEGNTLLSNRIRELKELAEQKKDQQTALAGRMAFFKKYHDQLRITALDGDTKVSAEMAEILGLSNEEQQAVDHHLKETSDAINKIENANEFVAKQDANGFTIETPADPQGKVLEDALAASLSADIGADRAAFLMSYMEDSSSGPFGGFAQAKKDLEITWANQNGKLLYTIKNQFYDPKGQGNSASWYTTSVLPPEYQKYLQPDSTP